MKISQDGKLPQAACATNGKLSNGNSTQRENPDKEDEGEEAGEQNAPVWGR